MDKEKLLDFIGPYSQDLFNELMGTNDVAAFVKKHEKELRTFPGYFEVEGVAKDPFTKVAEMISGYDNLPENYIADKAMQAGLSTEEFKAILDKINSMGITYAEKQKLANQYVTDLQSSADKQKAVDEYQHSYLGMDVDNPFNRTLNWLADVIISDATKKRIVEDPNNTAGIVGNAVVDIAGTGADFLPGVGGVVVGPALRLGRDVANADKSALDIAKDAAFDVSGNVILDKGMKGIPHIGDWGPARKIIDAIPTGEWAKKAKTAKAPIKNTWLELPPVNEKELLSWVEKQPKELRETYYAIMENNPTGAREAIVKKIDELSNAADLDTYKQHLAESWVNSNKVKAGLGSGVERIIIGGEKTGARKKTETDIDYSKKAPTKTKQMTYDETIKWIIDNNEKQWEAGFAPNAGIELEAYNIWKGMKGDMDSPEWQTLKNQKSFTDWYGGIGK